MSEKDLEYYMSLPYRVEVYPEPDGTGYTAVIPELPGCMTCADTLDELWNMVEEAKEGWLELSLGDGDYIPEPAPVEVEEYSGKFVLRLPTSLHRQLAKRAEQEGTSLNQLAVMLLAEGMGRWSARPRAGATHFKSEQAIRPFQRDSFEDIRRSLGTRVVKQVGQESAHAWQHTPPVHPPVVA
jgi:antitoxin HicB